MILRPGPVLSLLALSMVACGDATEPEGPLPASMQVDSIRFVDARFDAHQYLVALSNRGEQPGSFKIQTWGHAADPDAANEYYGETDAIAVTADYEESVDLIVHLATDWILVLTRAEDSDAFATTDSVNLEELSP